MTIDVTPELVLAKTSKGVREVAEREHGLSLRLRRVLILIDGKTRLDEIERVAGGIVDLAEAVQALVTAEFVSPVDAAPAANPKAAATESGTPQEQLVQMARQLLGDHAERVVARLESGGADAAALGASVEAGVKLIRLTISEDKANEFMRRARRILSPAA